MRPSFTVLLAVLPANLAVLPLLAACKVEHPNPNHCSYLDGDRTCAERYPGERTFCRTCGLAPGRDGCVAERPEDNTCYSPCGNETRFEDDATCLMDTSSSSGEESTSTGEETGTETGSSQSSTTGPMPCVGNEDCPDAAAPLCEPVSGECVACDGTDDPDGACAGLDPMAPLCVNGACVACTPENPIVCDDQLLLCDGGTNTCIQCTEHAQCGSGACELDVGRCFPEDFVVHVDADGGADHPSVVAALDAVDDGLHGVIVVHDRDDGIEYQGVTIDGSKTIALLAAPGEAPALRGPMASPGLRVEGAGTVLYMDGLTVSLSPAQGLLVDGAFAWVDRSRIVQNSGGGVLAQGGADVRLRNCFVGGNGAGGAGSFGIDVNGSDLQVLYSTVARNDEAVIDSIRCMNGTADVRNSIVVGRDPDSIDCPGILVANSALDQDIAGNINVGAADLAWFVNGTGGDFHLTPDGAMIFDGLAQWQAGDPPTDIDGELRPTVDGTPDYAGADLVP